LKPERLVYIALRDVDEHEKTNIRELGIKVNTGYPPAGVRALPTCNECADGSDAKSSGTKRCMLKR
jgi:hypothetical protein